MNGEGNDRDAGDDSWAAFGIVDEAVVDGLRSIREAARERGRERIVAYDD